MNPVSLRRIAVPVIGVLIALALWAIGDPREFARAHGAKQRISIATASTGGVFYPYGGAVARVISRYVPNVEATAEVTAAAVDNLKFLRNGTADLAFVTADALDEGVRGVGSFARFGRVPARTLAVLYTNYTYFVTLHDKHIDRLEDLRGRVVATNAPGSGSELTAFRVLRAVGLDPFRDVQRQGLAPGQSAEALKDGKIDAFITGLGVPAGSLLDLARTPGRRMKLLPTDVVIPALQREFGQSIYYRAVIPKNSYPDQTVDIPVLAVGSVLVAGARMSDDLAYAITKALFEHRDELIAVHPEARNLRLESAVRGSPAAFHPGAIRFYREQGVWTN